MVIQKITKIYMYTRFERLWHWLQGLMIIMLLITGFEVHGSYKLMGFQTAVNVHNFVGLSWVILFAFFVFWLLTTGEWKQYIPTTKKLFVVIFYYAFGIFRGKDHPVQIRPSQSRRNCDILQLFGIESPTAEIQQALLIPTEIQDWENKATKKN
ncbi:MAG: hypothetical protein B6230_01325 [Desulfobacteraceae bacterium 4572_89]|nr:MAG: hypothetical protein B6230_01325 [Desulfobacteraceae bacterium 4572_89]